MAGLPQEGVSREHEGSGVVKGGSCPRAPPRRGGGGGRQNPAKELKKNYMLRNYKKSEKYNENVVIIF